MANCQESMNRTEYSEYNTFKNPTLNFLRIMEKTVNMDNDKKVDNPKICSFSLFFVQIQYVGIRYHLHPKRIRQLNIKYMYKRIIKTPIKDVI